MKIQDLHCFFASTSYILISCRDNIVIPKLLRKGGIVQIHALCSETTDRIEIFHLMVWHML